MDVLLRKEKNVFMPIHTFSSNFREAQTPPLLASCASQRHTSGRAHLCQGLATMIFSTTSLWTVPPCRFCSQNSRTLMRSEKHLEKSTKSKKLVRTLGLRDLQATSSVPHCGWATRSWCLGSFGSRSLVLWTMATAGNNAFWGTFLKETNDQKLWML